MKKSLHLLALLASVVLFSSCASVFEARNYSHLHYVKVKDVKKDETTAIKNQTDDETPQLLTAVQNKIVLPEQQEQLNTKSFNENRPVAKSSKSREQLSKQNGNIQPHSQSFRLPELPILKKQQQKMESAANELFGNLDHDLRMALIFGIAGIIVTLLGGLLYTPGFGEVLYVIGVILIIIGLVYLIKYLVENG